MSIRAMVLTATACAATLPAQAAEPAASRQENIGVVSGLAIGALAGGPFGAIFGAATGAWLGDRYHKQKVENTALAADLNRSQSERVKLDLTLADIQMQHDALAKMLEERRQLEAQVSFRTGDATLSAGAAQQLQKLGELAATMPQVQVRVAGYADPRGGEEFNQALSQERAEAVATVLANSGIQPDRLIIEAHGESTVTAADGDVDGYALERRVVIQLEPAADEAVAQSH
jgi:outer membrane protein OmpA-like peptidoglycan-associated protein